MENDKYLKQEAETFPTSKFESPIKGSVGIVSRQKYEAKFARSLASSWKPMTNF